MRKERWRIYSKKADFNGLAKQFGIDPVIARIIRNRDVVGEEAVEEYLYGDLKRLRDPYQMKDLEKAAELLLSAIEKKETIVISSDFDNDGIFSAQVLLEGIERLGGTAVIKTPHRVLEGYGVNERIVGEAVQEDAKVLLTCDNGIAAFEALALAKQYGMTVIITDHHEVPFREQEGKREYLLPQADAIVDPKQEDCAYPFDGLCGTGVAWKLIQVLYEKRGIDREELLPLLEYTAIATVADVMELKGENRILVKEGLKLLATSHNIGLRALMEAVGIVPSQLSAYHIGFVIGPCFNAAGRLETVQLALDLLAETDHARAMAKAEELKALNDRRKEMTEEGVRQAIFQVEQADWREDPLYLVYLSNCHESVAGIIAGRLRERYARPVLVFTDAEGADEGVEWIKGSGRSIEAYHMFEALNEFRELFVRFGGHAMAAGLTMEKQLLPELRQKLKEGCHLTEEDLSPVVHIDVAMPLGYLTEPFVEQLGLLAPFGKGNEKPLFAQQQVRILRMSVIGKNRNVMKLLVCGSEQVTMDALYFGDITQLQAFLWEQFGEEELRLAYEGKANHLELAITYYPQINEYRGQRSLQIVIQNYCTVSRKSV